MPSLSEHATHQARSAERLRLLGLTALVLLAGGALEAAGGSPRWPAAFPRLNQVLAVLSGSTLPPDLPLLVLVDAAWLMWLWIVGSLVLEGLVVAAEAVGRGAIWVTSLRRIADRLTLPLVRRAVAAAFAVQILSRGVVPALAEPLPPPEAALVVPVADAAHGAQAAADAPAGEAPTYVVRDGDTLWSIADQAYGSGAAYRRVLAANLGRRMPDGRFFTAQGVIRPGWKLVVPSPDAALEEVNGERWYTVQPGDTLSGIAGMVMGDDSAWPALFELNRAGPGAEAAPPLLSDPNVIWPGLRLRLPAVATAGETATPPEAALPPQTAQLERAVPELVVASAAPTQAPPPALPAAEAPTDAAASQPPLGRTPHDFAPVALEPADSAVVVPDDGGVPADSTSLFPSAPPSPEVPLLPLALSGAGLAGLAGLVMGGRRLRRLRRLRQVPESEVVVAGGFADAQLTPEFTRVLEGAAVDPLAITVLQLHNFLAEYHLPGVRVVAARHGRSGTTLTLRAALAEQPLLVDLATVFGARLEAQAEAWVSADQDVVLRLERLRRTRLLPASAGALADAATSLLPIGVLYDRQTYWAAWPALGNILIASLPGHGADTILTSLLASLTARRPPHQLRLWLVAEPRALPAPLFELPHLVGAVDPADDAAMARLLEQLRAETAAPPTADQPPAELLVVVPELTALGEHAARLGLLAAQPSAERAGVTLLAATSCPQASLLSPLLAQLQSRLVLRMHDEETSVALLGAADAAFLGGGGRLLLRLDGREPLELYGYQVRPDHLERLVRVMRSAYPAPPAGPPDTAPPVRGPAPPPASASAAPEPRPATAERVPEAASDSDATAHIEAPRIVADPVTRPSQSDEVAGSSPSVRDTQRRPLCEVDPAPNRSSAPPLEVVCFGGPRVVCGGAQVWPRPSSSEAKPWELLLYLACQPVEGVAIDTAVEALWPEDEDSDNAPHRFRQLRYRLRRSLSGIAGAPDTDGICLDRGILRLDPGVVHSDAQEFLTLVRAGRLDPGLSAIAPLERARALFLGDLLEGPDARRYAWLDERDQSGVTLREHFRRLFEQASTKLAELYASSGNRAGAIDVYRELTEIDPGDERLWRALFRLHAESGDRPALVREEHRLRQALRDLTAELEDSTDVRLDEPSRELIHEYQRLLASLREVDRAPARV